MEEGLSVDGSSMTIIAGDEVLTVLGSGGALVHTGLTPYERREAELVGAFENAMKHLDYRKDQHPLVAMLSHHPPYDLEADLRHGSHTGSRGLRHLLDALKPQIWLCGHIHEARSISRSGSTVIVNPGPLREGYYAIIEARKGAAGYSVEADLRSI